MLPPLREELALYPAPRQHDGHPAWTLHDPPRNRYFQIDWLTFEILSRWSLGNPTLIAEDVADTTPLQAESDDVDAVTRFLAENQLLQSWGAAAAGKLAERERLAHPTFGQWLLHNYLFIRLPLVRPDAWLSRWARYLDFLYSKRFAQVTLVALVIGLVLVYRDWARFSATLVDNFSLQGMLNYGLALTVVKILHELGHAITAKRYGCRVPTMGVAFMVLWPMPYTDTNEVWKLNNHKQRLNVAAAGVITELVVAVWATLAWALLSDGPVRSMAFVLATLTWVMSIMINWSPFMRFDGYFLVSDALNMPNLHSRAFALARWDLRERLFDLQELAPEHVSAFKHRALILFAWGTWLYRLALFLGIAVLVYHFFIKAVGIFLFMVEIAWFIAKPLQLELSVWHQKWPQIKAQRRSLRNAVLFIALLSLTLIPWPSRISTSGILQPLASYPVHAPGPVQIKSIPYAEGQRIAKGAVILELTSPELFNQRDAALARIEQQKQQLNISRFDPETRAQLLIFEERLAAAQSELAAIDAEIALLTPQAPFDGQLRDLSPDLHPGQWLSAHEKIATLVRPDTWKVEAYLDEQNVRRVHIGDAARFYTDTPGHTITLSVHAIDRDATRALTSGILTLEAGGNLQTRMQNDTWVPDKALYRVTFTVEEPLQSLSEHTWRGNVVIQGEWQAPITDHLHSALALLWRELGF